MRLLLLFMFGCVSVYGSNAWGLEKTTRVVGTNLEGIADYSGDWPFVNRMKSARKWITFDATGKDKSWDTQVPIPSDENGYPLSIPFDPDGEGGISPQGVRTILIAENDHYPAGEYTLIFEGKGKLHMRVDAQCPNLRDGQCIFDKPNVAHRFIVKKPKWGLRLKILSSVAGDHIRNIRILPPGVDIEEKIKFHPVFLERLRGFKILRFMDWASTNHSKIKRWSERVHPDYYTYALKGSGVPYEVMVDLSNKLKADAWFTIPTYVDDNFVQELARLINKTLDKDRRVYIEYSNEAWNKGFIQGKYVAKKGIELAASLNVKMGPRQASAYYYAYRAAQIFNIFEKELTRERHLSKVVSGQGTNPWVLKWVLEALDNKQFNPSGVKPDAMSIGFYMGGPVADQLLTKKSLIYKKSVSISDVKEITLDQIFAGIEKDLLENRQPKLLEHKKMADKYNLLLLGYEGGQALRVGYGYKPEVLDLMTSKLIQANRDIRMKSLYSKMFDTWFESGGNHFMNFSYIYDPGRHGSWGILEYQWQNPDEAPKYQAVMEQLRLAK